MLEVLEVLKGRGGSRSDARFRCGSSLMIAAHWGHTLIEASMRTAARSHRDLIVWKEGMTLLVEVYRLAARLPAAERYGIGSQLRRAAVSIPTNVAEGFARRSHRDFCRFLMIAEGSLRELQTLLEALGLVGYLDSATVDRAIEVSNRVGYLTHRLRRSLSRSPRAPRAPRAP